MFITWDEVLIGTKVLFHTPVTRLFQLYVMYSVSLYYKLRQKAKETEQMNFTKLPNSAMHLIKTIKYIFKNHSPPGRIFTTVYLCVKFVSKPEVV